MDDRLRALEQEALSGDVDAAIRYAAALTRTHDSLSTADIIQLMEECKAELVSRNLNVRLSIFSFTIVFGTEAAAVPYGKTLDQALQENAVRVGYNPDANTKIRWSYWGDNGHNVVPGDSVGQPGIIYVASFVRSEIPEMRW